VLRSLYVVAALILAFTHNLTAWWGILIVLGMLVFLSLGVVFGNPDREARAAELWEFFLIGVGQAVGMYVGYLLFEPWGAVIGLIVAHLFGASISNRLNIRAGRYEFDGRRLVKPGDLY
jgi:hypothetical protein